MGEVLHGLAPGMGERLMISEAEHAFQPEAPLAHRSLGPLPMVFPHPVFVIGTYGPDGVANLATAS